MSVGLVHLENKIAYLWLDQLRRYCEAFQERREKTQYEVEKKKKYEEIKIYLTKIRMSREENF